MNSTPPRVAAFYYPQFHRQRLNDHAYGNGHTEWDNVERGLRLFPGHRQPRISADLGRYDLANPEIYPQQVQLAQAHGISAFCFYHYWFTGSRRLLSKPFDDALNSDADFPFFLMWANHDWSMMWRNRPHDMLIDMTYHDFDPADFVRDIGSALADERYVRVDGRPLLIMYDIEGPPSLERVIDGWREEASRLGVGELFVAGVQKEAVSLRHHSAALDALCEFPPHGYRLPRHHAHDRPEGLDPAFRGQFFDYRAAAIDSLQGYNVIAGKRYLHTMFPDWDNTGRRIENCDPHIYLHAGATNAELWLRGLLSQAASGENQSLPLVMINAWNEWGEGAYLEPDQATGSAVLEAVRRAVAGHKAGDDVESIKQFVAQQPGLESLVSRRFSVVADPGREVAQVPLKLREVGARSAPWPHSVTCFSAIADIVGSLEVDAVRSPQLRLRLENGHRTYELEVPRVSGPATRGAGRGQIEAEGRCDFAVTVDFSSVDEGEYRLLACQGDSCAVFGSTLSVTPQSGPESPAEVTEYLDASRDFVAYLETSSRRALRTPPEVALQWFGDHLRATAGPASTFDLSTCSGQVAALALSAGHDVAAVVAAEPQQKQAMSRFPTLPVHVHSLESMSWTGLPAQPVELLLLHEILSTVRRPDGILLASIGLLAPGNRVLATVPDISSPAAIAALNNGDWLEVDGLSADHLRFFNMQSFQILFQRSGFRVHSIERLESSESLKWLAVEAERQ